MAKPNLHILEKEKDWENAVLDFITATIADVLSEKDYCTISLSGGSTPKRIYELLAESGSRRGIDWDTIHLYWGDERGVPHDHEDSNYKMVKEALLRSEEHTSELQSRGHLVCRLLLEKKNKDNRHDYIYL